MNKSLDTVPPKSKFIELLTYDENERALDITFKNGTKYRYLNVFPSTWLTCKQAQDHGVFYSHLIKGKFRSISLVGKKIGHPSPTQRRIKPHVKRSNVNSRGITSARGTVSRALAGQRGNGQSRNQKPSV